MEIGDRPRGAGPVAGAGFTLLEILLALALIGLIAAVFIGVSTTLFADKPKSVDDQFWAACGEARKAALDGECDVTLSFDDRSKSFVIDTGGGAEAGAGSAGSAAAAILPGGLPPGARAIPVTFADPKDADQLTFDFLSSATDSSMILVGGTVVQTQTIPFVTFFSDGTCTPFKAQFRLKGDAHVLAIDPWTCAACLPAPDTSTPSS